MARKQVVSYTITCDVCGDEITAEDTDEAAHKFSLDGPSYKVDTCVVHGKELSDLLDRLKVFVDAGSRQTTGGRRRTTAAAARAPRKAAAGPAKATPSAPASEVAAIRAWAVENGHTVGDRGRIPSKIAAAYYEAKGDKPNAPARKGRPRKAKAPATAE